MAFQNGARLVTDGLVLSLDAADRNSYVSGSLIWNDLSGNLNSGSLINGPIFNSGSAGSIVFDGIDDYIKAKNLNLQADFSFETIASINPLSTNAAVGFFGQGVITTNSGLHCIYSSGSRGFIFGMYNNDIQTDNAFRPIPSAWFQVTFTYDSASFQKKIYINGTQASTSVFGTQAPYSGSGQVNIAAAYSSPDNFFNGKIAISRLYNKVLSPAEVLQNYNAQKSRFGLK